MYDFVVKNATICDGSLNKSYVADVGVTNGIIKKIGDISDFGKEEIDASNLVLCPGFIDSHTHDDIRVIRDPDMLPKISQGVTTVIVGNCGISASPVVLPNGLTEPINLLGVSEDFKYRTFVDYKNALNDVVPSVNIAALVGHTSLRNNHMSDLHREANPWELRSMQRDLTEAMENGALGLSTGLAYASAFCSTTEEIQRLATVSGKYGGIYATHLRSEGDFIDDAVEEAIKVGKMSKSSIIVSHLKCNESKNWGRSEEILNKLTEYGKNYDVGWDCYPYSAGSTVLDPKQVTSEYDIIITWSKNYPEMTGKKLMEIAGEWKLDVHETTKKLMPAGATYFSMDEKDVRNILKHPLTMIGSDGLPNDPFPHPRLWSTFPRVLGFYCRDLGLFSLEEAVHKMTGLTAKRYGLDKRGLVEEGYIADLVLFDPKIVADVGDYSNPKRLCVGIKSVFVNGILSYSDQRVINRAGKFIQRK